MASHPRLTVASPQSTIDPAQIQSPSQIPPPGSQFEGISANKLVDVFCGTLPGDIDAQPAAKELLGTALDTGGLSNADFIYTQVKALYGGGDLPDLQSPSGNTVKTLVFVSGSAQGGYGAFHIEGQTLADFDRIVVDSLNASGNYSAGTGLGTALAPTAVKADRLLAQHRGAGELLSIIHAGDPRLKKAKPEAIEMALKFSAQSLEALKTAIEMRNTSAVPRRRSRAHSDLDRAAPERRLVHANQSILGLTAAALRAGGARQYLSTALFAAEVIESFQLLTSKANPGQTDGEAVSRVVAFKLAPEIAMIPGFSGGVAQQWWQDGHPDWVNDNSQNDQSVDGNGAGVMFLLFLNDYLGIAMDRILAAMPTDGGQSPLGKTYEALTKADPSLANKAGRDGPAAFQKMVALLQNGQNPDGTLNLPADGNPFPSMQGAQRGGLFAGAAPPAPSPSPTTGPLAQDAQSAIGLESQIEQQLSALKATLSQIPADVSASPAPAVVQARASLAFKLAASRAAGPYGPNLPNSVVANLEQEAAPFRAPQYDQTLQGEFWPHVYNELPGSGTHTDRLQVMTGTNQAPLAVQITGTITSTAPQKDGDLHITIQPDDASFPTNQDSAEAPLEVEIIYAGKVTQQDAKQAEQGFTNPFATATLAAGTRVHVAGPLIFDRAHGKPAADGKNVQYGLEIHPVVGITVLGPDPPPTQPPPAAHDGQLSADLTSALNQAGTLSQTLQSLTALIQKMQGEAPVH